MERWMIVYVLPLEVWMDIFGYPWITRQEFGQLVHKLGNRKFAEHAQFYLHEWGKRKLPDVCFNENVIMMNLPRTPIPSNFKSFGCIQINHFDTNTIAYMGQIRALLTGVDIQFSIGPYYVENIRAILANLAPFVAGIHSLHCCERSLPVVWQCFSAEQLAKIKLIRYSHFRFPRDQTMVQPTVNTLMDWLTPPGQNDHNDYGPRLCEINFRDYDHQFAKQLTQTIQQQFRAAKTPRTFTMIWTHIRKEFIADEFHLENGIGEQLHGMWTQNADGHGRGVLVNVPIEAEVFQITRHSANSNTGEVRAWIKEVTKREGHGSIHIAYPTISYDVQMNAPPNTN